jgi:hypothetical protein
MRNEETRKPEIKKGRKQERSVRINIFKSRSVILPVNLYVFMKVDLRLMEKHN